MKFKYFRLPFQKPGPAFPNRKEVFRPMIWVDVKNKEKALRILSLVDSGSDNCLFAEDFGKALGIDIKSGIRQDLSGIKGEPAETYFHDVTIIIGGWETKARVGFIVSKNPANKLSFGILGHNPVFEKYKILFDVHKKEVIFKEH
jgi:hypothetical protein